MPLLLHFTVLLGTALAFGMPTYLQAALRVY
jgi:hypothetical protein